MWCAGRKHSWVPIGTQLLGDPGRVVGRTLNLLCKRRAWLSSEALLALPFRNPVGWQSPPAPVLGSACYQSDGLTRECSPHSLPDGRWQWVFSRGDWVGVNEASGVRELHWDWMGTSENILSYLLHLSVLFIFGSLYGEIPSAELKTWSINHNSTCPHSNCAWLSSRGAFWKVRCGAFWHCCRGGCQFLPNARQQHWVGKTLGWEGGPGAVQGQLYGSC